MGGKWKQWQILSSWTPKLLQMLTTALKLRHLLLGRKAMTNLDSILKSIDIILPTKVHIVRAMVFLVVMFGCESWTIKKAEHRNIDPFELWCWRRLLRVPWIARRSNQSVLNEINPEYSLERWIWSSNTLATWCEELTHWKKTLMLAGKDWRQEEKGTTEEETVGWHLWLNGHEFEQTPGVGDGQGGLACWVHGITKSWTQLSNWTKLKIQTLLLLLK